MRLRRWLAVILCFVLFSPLMIQAQDLDCDDPFAGVEVRFPLRFWPNTDFCQSNVDFNEILSGGPPPDGIPPIDNPVYESIESAAEWLAAQSPVAVVTVNDETRAYPLAILTWHEIVNTELGGQPITVTFCPLCNSTIVFDRNYAGVVLDFGVSGNLRNSDLIMYDRQTYSWWQQFTGTGIVGDYTDAQLTMLPSQVVSFEQFRQSFPNGEVLSRQTGATRDYGRNPYVGYDGLATPFLFIGDIDNRLPAMAYVLAGLIGGDAMAYPVTTLKEATLINDTVDDVPVLALWQAGAVSALDSERIDNSNEIGTAALYRRTLDDDTVLTFSVTDEGVIVDDQTGSIWNVFGLAESGALEGTQLRQVVAGVHFWFAWSAFRPDSPVYGLDAP